jgi:hypothetical protein
VRERGSGQYSHAVKVRAQTTWSTNEQRNFKDIYGQPCITVTYDHRTLRTELPVRSAVLKQCTGGLVVRWVTTGEYPLLYVFVFVFASVSCLLNIMMLDHSFVAVALFLGVLWYPGGGTRAE